jgi:hypothetical protein
LAGEAFAAAAFGEQILALFRLAGQSVFVADYTVAHDDHLHDRLVAEVAYGFGVVPVLLRRSEPLSRKTAEIVFPRDDLRLHLGDRLVVLATLNGLKRIERGQFSPARRWRLWLKPPLYAEAVHDAGAEIARCSGCHLATSMAFVQDLPRAIELDMYTHQAQRLARALSRQFEFTLEPLDATAAGSPVISHAHPTPE